MFGIVENTISYLKLTMFRLLVCWILKNRHSNINKNILHRLEVHKISAAKSRRCDSFCTEICIWSLIPNRNVRFMCWIVWISLRCLCANVYISSRYHGNIIITSKIFTSGSGLKKMFWNLWFEKTVCSITWIVIW